MQMTIPASKNRLLFLALTASSVVSTAIPAQADLEFNRLTSCADIAKMLATLSLPPSNCSAPVGVISRTIDNLYRTTPMKLCFLRNPPLEALNDFKCVQSSYRESKDIACYRPIDESLVRGYKENYTSRYAGKASSYIELAKRCPGSNGDASRIVETTFPPILMSVAAHEFGFNSQYGATRPGNALVSHGFASTSPAASTSGAQALEYIVYSLMPRQQQAPRISIGNWRVDMTAPTSETNEFLKVVRRQGVDAFASSFHFDIMRSPSASPRSKAPSLLDALSEIAAAKIEDEGFEELTDDDFKQHTGKTMSEMADAVAKSTAFGAQGLLKGRLPTLRVLLKQDGIPCTKNGQGAVGAYLFQLESEKNVQAEFGDFSGWLVGLGSCASTMSGGQQYVRNLSGEIKEAILEDLRIR